jgi:alpha-mannosidase
MSYRTNGFRRSVLCGLCFLVCLGLSVFAQNDRRQNGLKQVKNGGFIENWLVSSVLPAEIDAGTWENFNRFNIENLPQKDWLAPFGGVAGINPQIGTQKAGFKIDGRTNPQSAIRNPQSNDPLPEVGAATNSKTLSDVSEISWRETAQVNPELDFYNLFGGKQIGTAYAAARIDSEKPETRFLETDGFLGAIWLNGEKIYDGYSLNVRKTAAANFKKGVNLLLIRASGVSGDYWRKNGGWTALIRFWSNEADALKSAQYKSTNANGTIFYLEGFHVDPVYLQDQRGYSKITLSNTHQYIQSLRADPKYGVFLSEIDYLKPFLDTHPEDREFLREAVKQGRVGTGGAYNQFNELTIGGETIIRNILYGQAMHQAMLGRKAKSLALWDVFGHAPQISQIAQKSGFNGIAWSKKIIGFEPFFLDYALDGSRLAHRRVDYAYSFSGFGSGKNYTLDNFRRMTERKFAETQSFNSSVDLRINAADFTPPWTNLAGNVEKLETNKPQIRVTGQAQDLYFDRLNEEIKNKTIRPPVTSRDKLFFHVGVMAARSDLKVAHRLAENATLTAEKFGTIAYLRGAKYPDLALDKAWRQIFFGSHHDAITGTPSDSAFLDLVHGYREAFELSKDALNDSLNFISRQIDTNPKFKIENPKSIVPIVVFNPVNWKRSDTVRVKMELPREGITFVVLDENGKQVKYREFAYNFPRLNLKDSSIERKNTAEFEFIAQNVPSLGYKTYYVYLFSYAGDGKSRQNETLSIENEFYKIAVEPKNGGAISSIYDKQASKEIINTANGRYGNEIAVLKEELTKKNVIYPAWEFWTTGDKRFSSEKSATVISYGRGDTETLAITGELPNMQKFTQLIELHKGVKRIDFKTELIDYRGKDELFVVNFPLNLTGGALVTEDRFGTVVRNQSKGFLDFRTNTDKLVSGAPVYGVNNWAEYGSVLNLNFVDAAGKSVSSIPFKPTALVRPHGENYEKLTEQIVSALIKRGVSVTPFYDDNDETRRKNLTIEDSTMPRKLNDDIAYHNFRIALGQEQENSYSTALLKQITAEAKQRFEARVKRDGFAYLFIRDKNVPSGWQPIPVLLIAGNVEKAVEQLLAPISKDEFALNVSSESLADTGDLPKVENYGVALINNGTPAVSLENPNTLTLFLTHTAVFPGVNLPFDFVPENKTHVFNYALYPHAGDWREADTVKVGENFNNPLIAVQTGVHEGNLPGEKSFLTVDKENIAVSALKLGGDPQANFRSIYKETQRPLFVRFYETEGIKTSPMFTFFQSNLQVGKVGLLEEPPTDTFTSKGNGFGTEINGFSIDTFFVRPINFAVQSAVKKEIGEVKEIVQPVFSRYWLHNSGAAPIGNDAVKVSLRRVEQQDELSTFAYDDKYNQGGTTTVAVRVQVVNNYQDRNYAGTVKLEAPDDWRIVPNELQFDIAPNGSFVKDVVIVGFPVKKGVEWERASGLIKARIEHEGQIFQDVLNIGKFFNLEWSAEKTADGVQIKIKNLHRQSIEGAVTFITPPEIWALTEPNFPREIGFSVQARDEIVLNFPDQQIGTWAIARISYNGFVDYKRADGQMQNSK